MMVLLSTLPPSFSKALHLTHWIKGFEGVFHSENFTSGQLPLSNVKRRGSWQGGFVVLIEYFLWIPQMSFSRYRNYIYEKGLAFKMRCLNKQWIYTPVGVKFAHSGESPNAPCRCVNCLAAKVWSLCDSIFLHNGFQGIFPDGRICGSVSTNSLLVKTW